MRCPACKSPLLEVEDGFKCSKCWFMKPAPTVGSITELWAYVSLDEEGRQSLINLLHTPLEWDSLAISPTLEGALRLKPYVIRMNIEHWTRVRLVKFVEDKVEEEIEVEDRSENKYLS